MKELTVYTWQPYTDKEIGYKHYDRLKKDSLALFERTGAPFLNLFDLFVRFTSCPFGSRLICCLVRLLVFFLFVFLLGCMHGVTHMQ